MAVKLYDKVALNQGVVLDLPGLEATGALIRDISRYHNNGTISGATWVQLGSGLWVLNFDGVDDFVRCNPIPTCDYFTLSAWINPTSAPADHVLIIQEDVTDTYRRYFLYYQTDSFLYGYFFNTLGNAKDVYKTVSLWDAWHMVAMSWDGTLLRLFVDGQQVASSSFSGTLRAASSSIYCGIGADLNADGTYNRRSFKGLIDEVRIYNRALSAAEIKTRFEQTRGWFGV